MTNKLNNIRNKRVIHCLTVSHLNDEAAVDLESSRIIDGKADAVAFGAGFLATLDLPERIAKGAEWNTPNPNTFYTPDSEESSVKLYECPL